MRAWRLPHAARWARRARSSLSDQVGRVGLVLSSTSSSSTTTRSLSLSLGLTERRGAYEFIPRELTPVAFRSRHSLN